MPPSLFRFGGRVSNFTTRSEERRVGKEWRSRWSPYHSKKRRHTIFRNVTGVQTCALPISQRGAQKLPLIDAALFVQVRRAGFEFHHEIGRASGRERVEISVVAVSFKKKTAHDIPKRDWSSDVCSSDLAARCAEAAAD